ncbi:ankyrin repeat domain-containing protein 13C-like [Panonychus citri]|uniref:ankyrin repeat domain-containing protein 13C-like n=1 Tax=Panonychus citri TaxID=50023 RepID=UPI0023078CE5|nr:ankyrin repeat domain-containing protein 13C-like [Panonychus citri]
MSYEDKYPLHKSVFINDLKRIPQFLKPRYINAKDIHGNTPLHLAVMLGHKECIQLLLAHGAPVKVKNSQGWSPLAEAISYGDRQTITCLLRKLKKQSREAMEIRRPDLIRALNSIGNFSMKLKWDFQSWVPLVSRYLPSDVCTIQKKGCNIRLDTTLVDFSDMKWERGDISFVFMGDAKPSQSLTVMDNKMKVYQRLRYEESEVEIEDEVDILMSQDIVAAQMSTKSITFTRAQSGWLFREDKTEMVGPFMADFYYIGGLYLESRKRREHLTSEDLQRNRAILENFAHGAVTGSMAVDPYPEPPPRRRSLPPPSKCTVTWDEYINCPSGELPNLGREIKCKGSTKAYKATLAMDEQFPLSVESLLNVLEVIAPFKHFRKLREFVQMKLPPGFPVKLDIPIPPFVTARITFQDFQFDDNLADDLFEVPSDYADDPNRFPEF